MSFIRRSHSTDGRATTTGRDLYSSRKEPHRARFWKDGRGRERLCAREDIDLAREAHGMRAIDVHVHPMTQAYVDASALFTPAAQRMFHGRFAARPDEQIAADFRRDDVLALPIAWDSRHGTGDPVFSNDQLADLCARFPDVFLPGWAMVDPWSGRAGLKEIERAIRDLGLLGVKYQPPVQAFEPSDRMFYPIWDLIQSLGAPVLIHCGTTAIGAGEPGGLGFKLDHGRPMHIDRIAADFPAVEHRRGASWMAMDRRIDRHSFA